MKVSERSHCEVCGNNYLANQATMFKWDITPGVSFVWCEYCDSEKSSHEGLHNWLTAFVATLAVAIHHLSNAHTSP